MKIAEPVNNIPVVDKNGYMINSFNVFLSLLSKLSILEGAGSPEGVVDARVTRLYMDTAGTAGNILYIKKLSDIGGDTKQGWILV